METGEFLKHFKHHANLGITRRKLQYYSSPQVRLLPLPVYRNRHTAHYIVPDHLKHLTAICLLREKYRMPIKSIRLLLKELPEKNYALLDKWGGSARDLLDAVKLFKSGYTEEDMLRFLSCKELIFSGLGDSNYDELIQGLGATREKKLYRLLMEDITKHFEELKKWVSSGRGVGFFMELGKSIGGFLSPEGFREKVMAEDLSKAPPNRYLR